MPSCNETLQVIDKETGKKILEIKCHDGDGHEGQHQSSLYVDLPNQATGKNGFCKHIFWS